MRLEIDVEGIEKKANVLGYAASVAVAAREKARPGTNTIVFLNTVARAQAVHQALSKAGSEIGLLLVHSRFRGEERKKQMRKLISAPPPQGRIVVATQALEAGVDVTSAVTITELAPWSSLVQRFGRCNRKGEHDDAKVFWIDLPDAVAPP